MLLGSVVSTILVIVVTAQVRFFTLQLLYKKKSPDPYNHITDFTFADSVRHILLDNI